MKASTYKVIEGHGIASIRAIGPSQKECKEDDIFHRYLEDMCDITTAYFDATNDSSLGDVADMFCELLDRFETACLCVYCRNTVKDFCSDLSSIAQYYVEHPNENAIRAIDVTVGRLETIYGIVWK